MISELKAGKNGAKGSRRQWIILGVWAFGVLLSLTVLLIWPYAMSSYDRDHRRELHCQVTGAEEYSGSTVSRTGLGSPFSYLRVNTANCGTLILQGVAEDEQGAVAEELQRGDWFEFSVGASSYWFRDALRLINRYPSAFAYESLEE